MIINAIKAEAENNFEFLEKICLANSSEEIMTVCEKRGFVISAEEASLLMEGIQKGRDNIPDAELSEDALEEVSGGFVVTGITLVLAGLALYGCYSIGKKIGSASK